MTKTLLEAIERGELSRDQLGELIADQAAEIGLSFADALELGRAGKLPRTLLGSDLSLLVQLFVRDGDREAT